METTHEFNISFLPHSPLLGVYMRQFESKNNDNFFNPCYSVEIGFIFFTIIYKNTNHSIENE